MGVNTIRIIISFYSKRSRNAGMPKRNLPINTPAAMHKTTPIVRYFSKKLITIFYFLYSCPQA